MVVSSASSSGLRAGQRPCLRGFWLTRDLPSAVRGPLDFAPLARLAAMRAADAGLLDMVPPELVALGWSVPGKDLMPRAAPCGSCFGLYGLGGDSGRDQPETSGATLK